MYRMKLVIGIALLASLGAYTPAWSQDQILLKNGGVLDGEVLGEAEDSVQIRLENVGIIKLAKADIEQVARGGKVKPTPTPAPIAEAERLGDLQHETRSRLDFDYDAKRNRPVPIPLELGGSPYQAFDNDPKTPLNRSLLRENPELALLVNQLMRGDTPDEQDVAVLSALTARQAADPGSLNELEKAALALESGEGPETPFVIEVAPALSEPLELMGNETIVLEPAAAPVALEIEEAAAPEPMIAEPVAVEPEPMPAAPTEPEPAPAAQEQAATEPEVAPEAAAEIAPEAVADAAPASSEAASASPMAAAVEKIKSLLSGIQDISYSEVLRIKLGFGELEIHSERKYRRPNLFASSATYQKSLIRGGAGMTQIAVQDGTILWQVVQKSEATLARLKRKWAKNKRLSVEAREKKEESFLIPAGTTFDLAAWEAADQDAGGQLRIGYILNPLESLDMNTMSLESEDEEVWTMTGGPSSETLKALGIATLNVQIGKADGILRRVDFGGESAEGAIVISDVKINPGLPNDTFSAGPPDDVKMTQVPPPAPR